MDIFLILFLASVLYFAWRGFSRGFVRSVVAILCLLLSAFAAIFLSPFLRPLISSVAEHPLVGLATPAIVFFICLIFLQLLFFVVLRVLLKPQSLPSRFGGAFVGSIYGVAMALWLIWGINIIGSTQIVQSNSSLAGLFARAPQSPITKLANSMMSKVVTISLQASGVEPQARQVISAIAADPAKVVNNIQKLTESSVTRDFLQNSDMRDLMAKRDTSALVEAPRFKAFVAQDEVKQLVSQLAPEQQANYDYYVAEKVSTVHRSIGELESDEEFQSIIRDPEIASAMQQKNIAALVAHPKFRRLIEVVLRQSGDNSQQALNTIDQLPSAGEASVSSASTQAKKEVEMYLWKDESGHTHYSEWNSIPPQYRPNAKKIEL